MTCAYIRAGTAPSGGIRPTSYRSCAIPDSSARPNDAGGERAKTRYPNLPSGNVRHRVSFTPLISLGNAANARLGTRRGSRAPGAMGSRPQCQGGPGRQPGGCSNDVHDPARRAPPRLIGHVFRLPVTGLKEKGCHAVRCEAASKQQEQCVEAGVLRMLGPGPTRLEVDDQPAGPPQDQIRRARQHDASVDQSNPQREFGLWLPPPVQRGKRVSEQPQAPASFRHQLRVIERVQRLPEGCEAWVGLGHAQRRALANRTEVRRAFRHDIDLDRLVEQRARCRHRRVLERWPFLPKARLEQPLTAIVVVEEALPHPERAARGPRCLLDTGTPELLLQPRTDSIREIRRGFRRLSSPDQLTKRALLDGRELHGCKVLGGTDTTGGDRLGPFEGEANARQRRSARGNDTDQGEFRRAPRS